MHALIVYAYPEPQSFNTAIKDRALTTLESMGWTAEVSDLHAMDFDPVPRSSDFSERADSGFFEYETEQSAAAKREHGS